MKVLKIGSVSVSVSVSVGLQPWPSAINSNRGDQSLLAIIAFVSSRPSCDNRFCV
jgi:hypothetical protein